ncbi:hypothetical protein KKB18_01425 [bacterium]|nr:hypothetical protein [bacterium]
MNKIGKKIRIVLFAALGIMLFSLCLFIGRTSLSQPEAALDASSAPQQEVKQEKPEAFVDPIEGSMTIDERKAIFKVLSKLKRKVADAGTKSLEDIQFPFPKEEEDKEEAAAEATNTPPEDETEIEAEKEAEKPVFSMYVPRVAEDTACVVRTKEGKVQASVFVTVYYNWQASSIQNWRLTFEQKPEPNEKGEKDWIITEKTIVSTKTDLYHLYMNHQAIYSFTNFEFTHDRIHVKYNDGYFITISAGDKALGGILIGKGEFSYDPPRQLAKDITDSDNETYQLMRYTGTKEVEKYTGGKTKLYKEPFKDGFIWVHPSRFSEFVKTSDFKVITDKALIHDLMTQSKEIFENQFVGGDYTDVKKSLTDLPGDDLIDSFVCGVKTRVYNWLVYVLDPYADYYWGGVNKEIILMNQFNYLASQWKDTKVWGLYDIKEQRENWTRAEQEHEAKDKIWITHQTVECNVLEKNPTHAEIKAQLTLKVMKDNVDSFPLMLLPSKYLRVFAVTDEDGFPLNFSRHGFYTYVYPNELYRIAQERKLTFYIKGQITDQITLNTYDQAGYFAPDWGYLKSRSLDLLVKTPKPLRTLSVGGRIDEWEEGNFNVVYWKSDLTVMHWSIIYAPYQTLETVFDAPYGPIPFYTYYQPTEEVSVQFSLPWQVKAQVAERYWRDYAKGIFTLTFKMASMKRIQDEMEGVMTWLETLYGKYPYPKMAVTHKSLFSWYAQGFPSMLQFWGSAFWSDKEYEYWIERLMGKSRWSRSWGDVIPGIMAHEAGHQWWGNIVGWLRMEDQWLSEGFTEQQTPGYVQNRTGNDILLKDAVNHWKEWALEHDKAGPLINGNMRLEEAYTALTYGKAPFIMNMLRMSLGEKAFNACEQQFIKIFGFKMSPSTNDFVEIVNRTLGEKNCMALFNEKDMNWYFDQWIYGMGIPEYGFAYKAYKAGDTWKAKCRVKVLNNVLFKIRTRVWVYPKDGIEPYPVWVLLEKKNVQEFEIDLKGEPKKLTFNEFDAVLTRGVKSEDY